MKPLIILTSFLVISFSGWAGKNCRNTEPCVRVISRQADIFYFKVSSSVIGAEVEVFSENGQKVMTQIITGKHTLIDLYEQNAGNYSIFIRKGDFTQKFDYNKKSIFLNEDVSSIFKKNRKPWRYA